MPLPQALGTVSGSPYALPSAPTSIAVASDAAFLYVGTVNGIYLYTVGSGGALTIGNSGNPIATDIPAAMVISGSWLDRCICHRRQQPAD